MMSLQLQHQIFQNFSLIVARWGAHRGTIPTVIFFQILSFHHCGMLKGIVAR
jgi:hypothetical protein